MGAWFPQPTGGTYSLTSDPMYMASTHKCRDTFDADVFMVWDPVVHEIWESNCLDKMLNYSAGELRKGQQMRHSWTQI